MTLIIGVNTNLAPSEIGFSGLANLRIENILHIQEIRSKLNPQSATVACLLGKQWSG